MTKQSQSQMTALDKRLADAASMGPEYAASVKAWLALKAGGRKGGKAKSERKARAARKNGRKGGRPRKEQP